MILKIKIEIINKTKDHKKFIHKVKIWKNTIEINIHKMKTHLKKKNKM